MDKTLYVVSGFMRTGTSMMMKALEVGGMDAVYRQSREVMRKRFADEHYDPNIGGLYELERNDYLEPGFPRGHEGKLIKALNMEHQHSNGVLKSMSVMPYGIRVVFMKRNPEEIRQSFNAFFDRYLPEKQIETLEDRWRDCIDRINNRKDVRSLDVFWYREVVEKPLEHFEKLNGHGWPVDSVKATGVVDQKYCRFRIENLTPGVL